MSMDNKEYRPGSAVTPRMIVGLAIALFGVVLVLDRLNLVDADQALRWWPAVIVAVGALIFTQSRRVGGGVNGVIVMIIGAWLLLNSVGILRVRFWEMFWALIHARVAVDATSYAGSVGRRERQHDERLRGAERHQTDQCR